MVSGRVRGEVVRLAAVFVAAGLVAACVAVRDESARSSNAPPPATARVHFSSQPGNAEIYVDGKSRGTTYVKLTLPAGDHEIEMRLAGFTPWARRLTVVAGDDTTVTATLQPAGSE